MSDFRCGNSLESPLTLSCRGRSGPTENCPSDFRCLRTKGCFRDGVNDINLEVKLLFVSSCSVAVGSLPKTELLLSAALSVTDERP